VNNGTFEGFFFPLAHWKQALWELVGLSV